MVWFGALLEPVTTQRFLSVRNSALDTITVSERTAVTVTVATFADWAPALSTARYVNVYVPAAAALKVTTPPAPAAMSFASTVRPAGPESSRIVNESFTAVRVAGGVTLPAFVVTISSAEPLALDDTRTFEGGASSGLMATVPPARGWLKASSVSVGAATVSLDVAGTVSVRVAGLNSAWVMATSSETEAWKNAGTSCPSALRAAESFTQTA